MKITIKGDPAPKLTQGEIESIEADMDQQGVRWFYDELVMDGMSPRLAQMVASQECANIGSTDKNFNRRERSRMLGMDDSQREEIVRIAKEAGINTHGKSYNGRLGRYNDPRAWVADTHDVRLAAEEKGYSLRGMVNVDNEPKPVKKKRIAKDILDGLEKRSRSKDKALDERCRKSKTARNDLREALTEKHTKKRS